MHTFIGSVSDYKDKLYQADNAFNMGSWRTAMGYYEECLQYAERNGIKSFRTCKIRSYLKSCGYEYMSSDRISIVQRNMG